MTNSQQLIQRLSHSSRELFHSCARKYQIERLLKGYDRTETSPYFSRGHAWGAGIQTYLTTRDFDLALYKAWEAYWPEEELIPKAFQSRVINDLIIVRKKLDDILDEYQVATFNGKPAIELSGKIIINDYYYYVCYIDLVMQHLETGIYGTVEIKRTSSNLLDITPLYKNSDQALGYSVLLDSIAGEEQSDYKLIYLVGQDNTESDEKLQVKFHKLEFNKNLYDRLNWFISLGLDIKHLEDMRELNVYPKNGSSCSAFRKTCPHFGTCHLHSLDQPKENEPDLKEYQFTFHIDQLIADHLRRIKNV